MSFRLSEEQYETVKSACERAEVGSISEFTRLAVLQAARRQHSDVHFWVTDLAALGQGLQELDEKLEEMRKTVRRLLGGTANDASRGA
jgi:hypothetical protein